MRYEGVNVSTVIKGQFVVLVVGKTEDGFTCVALAPEQALELAKALALRSCALLGRPMILAIDADDADDTGEAE